MKLALVSALLDREHGGPATVLRAHASALTAHAQVQVYAGSYSRASDPASHDLSPDVRLNLFDYAAPYRWFYCKGLAVALENPGEVPDLIHAHMVWDHPVLAAARASRRHRVPLVLTPHGSLNLDGRNHGAAKAAYARLVLQPLLRDAAALLVLTPDEAQACRVQGVRCPIHVIPNGLPRQAYETRHDPDPALQRWPRLRNRRVLVYLGRLWSGKGLDILPQAWARMQRSGRRGDWLLVLAGPDYREYRSTIERQAEALGIRQQILFTGELEPFWRDALLAAASAFVLPSHGEGFSMSVLEAMAARLPLLITHACSFPEVGTTGAGLVMPATVDGLWQGLEEITAMSPRSLHEMGQRGWQLARQRYVLETVAQQLVALYRSCL